ncbi:MAG: hypothetical protein MMC23_009774 [Stictis urceolatum]|nr:hypothetical protein [Stictis urceolata]
MATVLGGGDVLPRRLTQLFSDNKKSYEALVQTRSAGPELSPLHLKLRIQKDRLIAWGIQWSDRSTAAQAGDIDDSLDRAGISDLVASIMCSIRDLLDEAESLQPQSVGLDMSRKMGKKIALSTDPAPGEWTSDNLRRLEEILKDLTTSIDTLCDLSRPRVESAAPSDSLLKQMHRNPETSKPSAEARKPKAAALRPVSVDAKKARNDSPARRSDLTDMTYIDPSLLRSQSAHARSSAAPPSYESIASGSENRVLAYFSLSPPRSDGRSSSNSVPETPVLLDYRQSADRGSTVSRPNSSRFEELLLALLQFSSWRANKYTGILKLTGWTNDAPRARCAYVYEIPRTEEETQRPAVELQPRSLLAFLQNGGDADSNNIPSLDNRYRLALNVAQSLMHLHEMNVTHQNVNSNNILFFIDKESKALYEKVWKGPILRKPYLTGFHQMSNSDRDTVYSGIYYHPSLGVGSRVHYDNVHDYYGLGLLLLEIGLWMPVGKFFKTKYSLADFKARLQDIYMKKLAAKCGESYMKAALFCMTAADNHGRRADANSGLPSEDFDGATRFRYNVISALERCCMIDSEVKEDEVIEAFAESRVPQPVVPSQDSQISSLTEGNATSVSEAITATPTASTAEATERLADTAKKIRVWSHELPELYSNYWTSTMFPKLERILRKALSRWESYTLDLFMAGENADTARPTVYMECASTSKVRRILRHLNKDLRLFEIKVVSGQIVRSKAAKKKKKAAKKLPSDSMEGFGMEHSGEDLNPHYQPKPACGASIGAYLNGNHLPPVTFGGAVLVNGEPYGMSVHHMLEDDEEMQLALDEPVDLRRSIAPRLPETKPGHDALLSLQEQFTGLYPFEVSEPAEGEDAPSTGYAYSDYSGTVLSSSPPPEALYPFEIHEDDEARLASENEGEDFGDDFWLDPNFDTASMASDDDLDFDMGDTEGVAPGSGGSLVVTQPALDDVREGFFPSVEDATSEHLTSHSLGHIHASSGLRRSRADMLVHELDWALIKITPSRLLPTPHLNHPPRQFSSSSHPPHTTILPSDVLASRSVHTHARSSGLFARGTILPTMRLVRMPGRISPSHSWQVRGGFGGGGDSGAWVFDDATGAVCGHVLAYSERSGVAYIAPMEVMVSDMEHVLGGKVRLPGAEATRAGSATGRGNGPTLPADTSLVDDMGRKAGRRDHVERRLPLMGIGAGVLDVSAG